MRTIALSMIVMSGAVMAAAGTLAEAMNTYRYNDMDNWGIIVVLAGIGLLACDLFHWGPFSQSETTTDRESDQRPANPPSP